MRFGVSPGLLSLVRGLRQFPWPVSVASCAPWRQVSVVCGRVIKIK